MKRSKCREPAGVPPIEDDWFMKSSGKQKQTKINQYSLKIQTFTQSQLSPYVEKGHINTQS